MQASTSAWNVITTGKWQALLGNLNARPRGDSTGNRCGLRIIPGIAEPRAGLRRELGAPDGVRDETDAGLLVVVLPCQLVALNRRSAP